MILVPTNANNGPDQPVPFYICRDGGGDSVQATVKVYWDISEVGQPDKELESDNAYYVGLPDAPVTVPGEYSRLAADAGPSSDVITLESVYGFDVNDWLAFVNDQPALREVRQVIRSNGNTLTLASAPAHTHAQGTTVRKAVPVRGRTQSASGTLPGEKVFRFTASHAGLDPGEAKHTRTWP